LNVPAAAIHLHPTAPLAPRALLPEDPGAALALAQEVLTEPRMFNHTRGLWGYTGTAVRDGQPLTIQATGIGGPSAAVVLEELAAMGLRRAIGVGSALGLGARGGLVVASAAICEDGASRALAGTQRVHADAELVAELAGAAPAAAVGVIVSADLFYAPQSERWQRAGALAFDMRAATLLALAAARGVALGCIVSVDGDGLEAGRAAALVI
jgi:uridine phosphorylase